MGRTAEQLRGLIWRQRRRQSGPCAVHGHALPWASQLRRADVAAARHRVAARDRVRLGATPLGEQQTQFVVWAPKCREVAIEIIAPQPLRVQLERGEHDYFTGTAPVGAGATYRVIPDDGEGRPDPASRYQPEGVHGPSQVIDSVFPWTDKGWRGLPLRDYIIYELH